MRMNKYMQGPIRQSLFLFFSILIVLAIAGCYAKGNEKTNPPAGLMPQATPVDGNIIKHASLKEEIEVTGSLIANQQADIVSELTRKITRDNVKEGNLVKAGTLPFQLDDEDLQAQLEKLRQQ